MLQGAVARRASDNGGMSDISHSVGQARRSVAALLYPGVYLLCVLFIDHFRQDRSIPGAYFGKAFVGPLVRMF